MSLIGDAMAQAGFSSQLLTSMMGQKSGIVPQGRGGVEIREPDEDDMEPLVREKALDPNDDGTPADITDEVRAFRAPRPPVPGARLAPATEPALRRPMT